MKTSKVTIKTFLDKINTLTQNLHADALELMVEYLKEVKTIDQRFDEDDEECDFNLEHERFLFKSMWDDDGNAMNGYIYKLEWDEENQSIDVFSTCEDNDCEYVDKYNIITHEFDGSSFYFGLKDLIGFFEKFLEDIEPEPIKTKISFVIETESKEYDIDEVNEVLKGLKTSSEVIAYLSKEFGEDKLTYYTDPYKLLKHYVREVYSTYTHELITLEVVDI